MTVGTSQNTVEIKEKVVYLGKTCKVVKGGRRFKFAALVVAGDEKGRVGIGLGKHDEVMGAKEKASKEARKNMVRIPLRDGRTIHHDIVGKYGAGEVLMRSAPEGTGIIAGGPARAVMELLGVRDIVVKSLRSTNPHNMLKAVINGLQSCKTPKVIADKRRIKIGDVVSQRESNISGAANIANNEIAAEDTAAAQ